MTARYGEEALPCAPEHNIRPPPKASVCTSHVSWTNRNDRGSTWCRRAIDYASIDPEADKFRAEVLMLVAAAALCAVFTGLRGEWSVASAMLG